MKQLRKLREEKKMTQAELAKQFQVSPSTIAMYERGERKPDPGMLLKISNFFNITTDYLLENEQKNPSVQNRNLEVEKLANELQASPEYLELHRLVKGMPKKKVKEVLNFAKYTNLKGKDRGPDDDDDF